MPAVNAALCGAIYKDGTLARRMPARPTTRSRSIPKRARRAATRRRSRTAPPSRTRSHARHARSRRPASREAELPAAVSGVLKRFGRALAAGDFPSVSVCFAYPSLYLTGADTHEFRDPLQVQTVFREGRGSRPARAADLGLVVERAADLGHGIYACEVRWGASGERAHCLVQESAVGTALIRTAVAAG